MKRFFNETITNRLKQTRVMAVLVIENPRNAVPVAQALLEGGIDVMELALRTPLSLEALKLIVKEVPDMLAGAGTILSPAQLDLARQAGAAFGVSPGFSEDVLSEALKLRFPFAPGILTPSALERALSFGCRTVKIFPAQLSGGAAYIKAIYAPYKYLQVQFLPLGGLTLDNIEDYLQYDFITAVGGSWIAPANLIADENWSLITERASAAVKKAQKIQKSSH